MYPNTQHHDCMTLRVTMDAACSRDMEVEVMLMPAKNIAHLVTKLCGQTGRSKYMVIEHVFNVVLL